MSRPPAGEVCFINIGARGIARRRTVGLVAIGLGALVALALVIAGSPRVFRLIAFAPFWLGALGVFQARAKT